MSITNMDRFKLALEAKFGENFTVSYSQMKEFIIESIKNKSLTEDDVMKSLLFSYRDYIIEYDDLRGLFSYLGYDLPSLFSAYAEKSKVFLHTIAEQVGSETELLNRLFFLYQNDKLKYGEYEIACYLMGYEVSEEFKKLSEEERKSIVWINDGDNLTHQLNDIGSKLMKCCNDLEEFNTKDFLIPSFEYFTAMNFIEDYMDQKNISNKVLVNGGLDRQRKNRLKTDGIKKKMDAFRLIFILDMNVTEAKQFLTLCGYCFSPLDKVDLFFMNYLNGKYGKVKNLEELTILSRKYCYADFNF